MRRMTLLFVLLGMSLTGFSQNQVATLQHNDSITGVFYGQNAYSSAYNAAANGDIITLSSGTFNAVNISKSITIRGAGCVYDSVTYVTPTTIYGNFTIFEHGSNTIIEGINMAGVITGYNSNNIRVTKCTINRIQQSTANNINWQFVNCIIKDFVSDEYYSSLGGTFMCCFKSLSIINCVVLFSRYNHNDIYNPTSFYNSLVLFADGRNIINMISNNSIIATVSGHTVTNCSFFNCINIKTGETSLFEGQTTQNVMEMNTYEDVFETFDGTISYENIYQLKNSIATNFLGHDGTEVGIYGGIMPYKTRPSYMIMKNCNVAGQTDENKKLNVEMELIGPDD